MSAPDQQAGARCLAVFLDEALVGHLYERDDVWSFRYARSWLDNGGHALAGTLPTTDADAWFIDTPTQRPVFWFFENLLPEEQALAAVARQFGLQPEQAFALLTRLGAESAGALTLLPSGERPPPAGTRPLGADALALRLRDLPGGSLVAGAPKHMSLAGAQHKLAVLYDEAGDSLCEPVGAQPSTHILKPAHPHPYYHHSVHNEYFCMRLAAAAGLPVPRAWLHEAGGQVVYLVERFDRVRDAQGTVHRLYAVDACQFLGIPRRNKYEAATLDSLRTCIDGMAAPALARRQVLGWLAFNWLIGNADAHLKNISFLRQGDGWRVAPGYDLLSTAVYAVDDASARGDTRGLDAVDMVMPLDGERRFTRVTRSHLRAAAVALGAAPRALDLVLDELLARLLPAADELLAGMAAMPAADAGALRMLRQLRHAVIGPLSERVI